MSLAAQPVRSIDTEAEIDPRAQTKAGQGQKRDNAVSNWQRICKN
jgi:hypothetical protein